MNHSFQHPLDNMYANNSLLLLETMIPYLEPSLQLPLALLIKFQEIQTLIRVFQTPAQLEAYGFNRNSCGNEELLSVLLKTMGVNLPAQMSDMQSLMHMANAMQQSEQLHPDFQPTMAADPNKSDVIPEDSMGKSRDDLIAAIHHILEEEP